jgi:hypothetical protein
MARGAVCQRPEHCMTMSIVTGNAADNSTLQALSSNPSLPKCKQAHRCGLLFGRNITLGGNLAGDLTSARSRDWTPRSPSLSLIARGCLSAGFSKAAWRFPSCFGTALATVGMIVGFLAAAQLCG